MRKLTGSIAKFMKREDGPTAVEYAAMIGLVAVVCIAAVAILGSGSSDIFNSAAPAAGATSGPSTPSD